MNLLINIKYKYISIPKPLKASFWFIVCSVLQKGISFLTVPIFTRMMSTEQFGVYSQYVSWYSVLLIFTSLSLYNGVFNNALIKYENNKDEYISSMQTLVGIITFGFFCIYIIFRDFFNILFGMTTTMVLLLFVELLVTPSLQFWIVRQRFDFEYRAVVLVTLIKTISNPILGIFFVYFSEKKDLARIISIVLIEVIICGYICIIQFARGRTLVNISYWKYAISFNIPLIPHYLAGSILNQGDRIMIADMVGKTEVALYSVANNIGQVLNIITMAITAAFTPWIYKKINKEDTNDISSVTSIILVLMAGLITIVMLIGPEILCILGTIEYQEAKYVIPPVAGSVFFVLLYNLLANIEFYYGIRKYVLIGSTVAAVGNIVLNYFFIQLFGYYAAGYTTLVCYIIYGLSHLLFAKKLGAERLENKHIFSEYVILGLSLFMIVLSVFIGYLYELFFVRYILLFVVMLILIFMRKTIVGYVKKMREE